ncbi:Helicase ATP-binding domain-containing protein [Forsythia ovata]|uniref:Helicase ATP-binding domain-containing protein n=1 Tax=Forsythia ovata TaxID=205694 RepID=A0ABD1TMN9_9LAMI
MAGYLSHWRESLDDPDTKIMRSAQVREKHKEVCLHEDSPLGETILEYIYLHLLGHEVETQMVHNALPHCFGDPGLRELNASQGWKNTCLLQRSVLSSRVR